MFEIKDTENRKIGSDRPRTSTIKDDHGLKMTVLKGVGKRLLNIAKHSKHKRISFSRLKKFRRLKKTKVLSKRCGKRSFLWSTKILLRSFETVISRLWSCCLVETLGRPEPNFHVHCAFNFKPSSNCLQSWKRCFVLTFYMHKSTSV